MQPIVEQIQVGPMANFAYLFGCPRAREVVLVDPAAEADKLLAAIARVEARLIAIVNTHSHVDHTAGNAAIKAATGAPIVAHQEARLGRLDPISAQFLGLLGGQNSPSADRSVQDGDTIAVGRFELQVIHVPGHSRGDIALYSSGLVFTGDALFVGGVGRTDLPGSSQRDLVRSLRDRLGKLPDDTIVYPGHDYGVQPTSTIGEEKRDNPFFSGSIASVD